MKKKNKDGKWSALPIRSRVGRENQPVSEVIWITRKKLTANTYNPNHVAPPELELLKISILKDGWTQPIVLRNDYEIVDGYHRYLVSGDPAIASLTDGLVPVVFLRKGLTLPEQMASTIRHNRARGVHAIVPMAQVVGEMRKQGVPEEDICKELGMEEEEYHRLFIYGKQGMPKQQGSDDFGRGWVPGKGEKDMNEYLLKSKRGTRVAAALSGQPLINLIKFCWDFELSLVPIDPALGSKEALRLAEHVCAKFLIGSNYFHYLNDGMESPGEAFVVYSSGSTGNPKGIMLSRMVVQANVTAVTLLHGFNSDMVHGTCLPLHHCNACMMSVLGTHTTGAKLEILSTDPEMFMAQIEATGVSVANTVPAHLANLCRIRPKWPSCLKYLVTAAAPLPRRLAADFYNLYGSKLVQGYGLSEAVNFSFMMPVLDDREFIENYVNNNPPVGKPLPGTEFRIVNGEVQVRGNNMDGYWLNGTETARVLLNEGWLRTGDLGEFDGNYLRLVGRVKDTINRGGETIYPIDVQEHWRAEDIAFQVEDIGELTDGIGRATTRKGHWGSPEKKLEPEYCVFRDIPKTVTGKIRRAELSAGAVCMQKSPHDYKTLLNVAINVAKKIASDKVPQSGDKRIEFIWGQACTLVSMCPYVPPEMYPLTATSKNILDEMGRNWKDIVNKNALLDTKVRINYATWVALMTEWPMSDYPQLMAAFLRKRRLLENTILEIGAGVGNCTELIRPYVKGNLICTDAKPELDPEGKTIRWDFDGCQELDGTFNTIFGVNCLHCSVEPRKALHRLFTMLEPGGTLVLAEGRPYTSGYIPWALTFMFGLFDGWWDRGGFLPRSKWIQWLQAENAVETGWSRIRYGAHDVGGLVWAVKSQGE